MASLSLGPELIVFVKLYVNKIDLIDENIMNLWGQNKINKSW